MDERRRHVRAKPTADLPAHVLYEQMPPITEALDVMDISVSGLAIVQGTMNKAPPPLDSAMSLKIVIANDTLAINAKVRWVARGMIGLELVEPAPETAKIIQRYVSELLERGGRS